jgi:hypothetical protein
LFPSRLFSILLVDREAVCLPCVGNKMLFFELE